MRCRITSRLDFHMKFKQPAGSLPPHGMNRTNDMSRGSKYRAGFTLLEVLIALTILAVSIGVLFTSFSMTANGTQVAHRDMEVASLAQSLLARIGADMPLRPGRLSGDVGDLSWVIEISPYGGQVDTSALPLTAFEISLQIQSAKRSAEALALKTLRLAPRS